MTIDIQRILCPIDFSSSSNREIDLAARLAKNFDAQLILQHNLVTGAGLGASWMHDKIHFASDRDEEERSRVMITNALGRLPKSVRANAEARLTYGALDAGVRNLAESIDADLIVITTHGESSLTHVSETEKLIESASCPVLATRDTSSVEWLPEVGSDDDAVSIPTVVPVDFSQASKRAIRYALDLQQILPIEITVLYVGTGADGDAEWAADQLAGIVPSELRSRVLLDVRGGDPVDNILDEETLTGAHLLLMGSHSKSWIENLLTGGASTSRSVLHGSACPVWFVPQDAKI